MLRPEHPPTEPPAGALRWFDRPPSRLPNALRGQVAVVLFWRADCLHSRIALDEVARAVGRLPGRTAAVAVHVPTTAGERDDARVRRAVGDRPVLVVGDDRRELCRIWGIDRLPAVVLLDAGGNVRAVAAGEPRRKPLADAVAALVREASAAGVETSLPILPVVQDGVRLQPTALCADGDEVWVASTGHGALYRIAPDGAVRAVVQAGVSFVRPTGMARCGEDLLVADAGAHLLRAVCIDDGEVRTIAGDGERSRDRVGGGYGTAQGLACPWGLAVVGGLVHFSQAAAGQLWQTDVATGAASAWLGAGNGAGTKRSLVDGHDEATFGEPHGLAAADDAIYVADAGHGAVRRIDLGHAWVRTVAQGLQRPTAVAAVAGEWFVADAARGEVLRCGPDGTLRPWLERRHGLGEPVALAVVGDELWIADLAADELLVADLAAEATGSPSVRRVAIAGALAPSPSRAHRVQVVDAVHVREFADVVVRVRLPSSDGEIVDAVTPCTVTIGDEGAGLLACDVRHATLPVEDVAQVLAPLAESGDGVLRVRVDYSVREAETGVAYERRAELLAPLRVSAAGDAEVELQIR